MANSKYEYVRSYEQPDCLLPNTYIVVRIDGRGFTKLTTKHKFVKPNDQGALNLMNVAAEAVMKDLTDLVLAYGQSDEYSFVFHRDCMLFDRRASKLVSTIVSIFTANYVFAWSRYFPNSPLTPPLPSFDGRAVCYPGQINLRDYLSWRQVDCHINNLYNTTFWALVQQGGMDPRMAEQELSGTVSAQKNEILFSRFGINYNNEPAIFRKGTVIYRDFFPVADQAALAIPTDSPSIPTSAHPQPERNFGRPISQSASSFLYEDEPEDAVVETGAVGPTFLSTTTTPSPSHSPLQTSTPSMPALLNEFPQPHNPPRNTSPQISEAQSSVSSPQQSQSLTPLTSPLSITSPRHLKTLTPLPLPPPTLRPSVRPPASLEPPVPAAHKNCSPPMSPAQELPNLLDGQFSSGTRDFTATKYASQPPSASPLTSRPGIVPHLSRKRNPSLSAIDNGPPPIPLRISSIPINAKPRKLSLPNQKSYSHLRQDEKENGSAGIYADYTFGRHTATTPPKVDPKMKELPSIPIDDQATRFQVMGSTPQEWNSPPRAKNSKLGVERRTVSHNQAQAVNGTHGASQVEQNFAHDELHQVGNKLVAPQESSRRVRSHTRLHSEPPLSTSALLYSPPAHGMQQFAFNNSNWTQPSPRKPVPNRASPPLHPLQQNPIDTRPSHSPRTPINTSATSITTSRRPSRSPPNPPPSSDPATPAPLVIRPRTPSVAASALVLTSQNTRSPKPSMNSPISQPAIPSAAFQSSVPGQSGSGTVASTKDDPSPNSRHHHQRYQSSSQQSSPSSHPLASTATADLADPPTTTMTPTTAADVGSRPPLAEPSRRQKDKERKKRSKARLVVEHVDIIKDAFWERRGWILSGKTS